MTVAGWITMGICWTFVIGGCAFLLAQTMRKK